MELVDTHCHIQSSDTQAVGEEYTQQLWRKNGNPSGDDLVRGAQAAGVTRLICVGCTLEDSQLAIDFASPRSGCWASIGIHPHEARHYAGAANADALIDFAALAHADKVVAVGECGLDFYYDHSPKEAQVEVLRFQLELALGADLPVIFHVREAFDEFWPIFDEFNGHGLRGVLHSYTDSAVNLAKALERGLYLGVNGIATFAKNPDQLTVYRDIPLDKLLLETDAPFLTPHPHRGSINEPKRIATVAEFLAGLRGEELEELARATTANARQLFDI
ncbi:MAG TPA: TatD family hydrolase [Candidatus Saccharimonadales bacterium]